MTLLSWPEWMLSDSSARIVIQDLVQLSGLNVDWMTLVITGQDTYTVKYRT